jgi:CheY-like chemotaxis protein
LTRRSGILLVDDDREDQFIFCDAMNSVDDAQPVHTETNGVDALRYLSSKENQHLPCVILADLNMPKMTGSELLKQVKINKHLKHIPVVIYTTSVNEMERQACLGMGAHAYITKPLTYSQSIEVAQMIAKLCNELQGKE